MAVFSSLRFRVKGVLLPDSSRGRPVAQHGFREPVGPGGYILKRQVRRI